MLMPSIMLKSLKLNLAADGLGDRIRMIQAATNHKFNYSDA